MAKLEIDTTESMAALAFVMADQQKLIKEYREKCDDLLQQAEELDRNHVNERTDLQVQLAKVQRDLRNNEDAFNEVSNEAKELRKKVEELEADAIKMQQSIRSVADEEIEELSAKLKTSQSENKRRTKLITQLQREINNWQASSAQMQDRIDNLKETVEEKSKEIEACHDFVNKMNTRCYRWKPYPEEGIMFKPLPCVVILVAYEVLKFGLYDMAGKSMPTGSIFIEAAETYFDADMTKVKRAYASDAKPIAYCEVYPSSFDLDELNEESENQ